MTEYIKRNHSYDMVTKLHDEISRRTQIMEHQIAHKTRFIHQVCILTFQSFSAAGGIRVQWNKHGGATQNLVEQPGKERLETQVYSAVSEEGHVRWLGEEGGEMALVMDTAKARSGKAARHCPSELGVSHG